MVNATQDITVDAEFSSVSDWELFIPTYVTVGSGTTTVNVITCLLDYSTTSYTVYDLTTTHYSFRDVNNSTEDTVATWTVVSGMAGSGILDSNTITNLDYRNITYSGSSYIPMDFVYGSVDYEGFLFIENELVYLDTIPALPNETATEFRIYIGVVNYSQELEVDLTLSNSKIYKDRIDCICSLPGTVSGVGYDIEAGPGRCGYHLYDFYSSLQGYKHTDTDIKVSAPGYIRIPSDVFVGPGSVQYNIDDFYVAAQDTRTSNICDIRTWSLEIDNFFLEEGSFCSDTETMYVDLTDGLYSIDINNSYFKMDDVPVVVTLSGIDYGYRMFYNPPDDFYTKGTLKVTAHTANNIGDVLERDYFLLHGYDVQYINKEMWAPAENIFVRMAASNEVFCANTAGESFYFETVDLPSYSLTSFIRPVSYVDLSSSIYPQSTAFFYGGVYTVRLSKIKDFRGNELADVIFTFEIENPI